MKKSPLFAALLLLGAPLVQASTGPLKDKAQALASAHKDSVLFLSASVEVEVTAGDSPVRKEERKIELLGTVIQADGLIVAPLSTLDVAASVDGRVVNGPQGAVKLSAKSNTKEVKILMPDGAEVAAKVVAKDPDLDLVFMRPEKPDAVKLTPINTADNAAMALLDDVIILGRLNKELNREALVSTSEVIAIVSKPRNFGKIGAQSLGMPVFNQEGKFLGIGINRFAPKGDSDNPAAMMPSNVVLPAADLLESAAQAKQGAQS